MGRTWQTAGICAVALLTTATVSGEPVAVRYAEGLVHGFLTLRTLDGTQIASGDLIQVARANRVTSRLTFHFKDGSLHDETAVFSQRGQFHLLTDHLVQKGPTFPQPLDMTIDTTSGKVTVRYTDEDGSPREETKEEPLPPDLANGMIQILLKNVTARSAPKAFSFMAATPKPRLVKLTIVPSGEQPFTAGGRRQSATEYVLKVDLGGVTGLVASLVGKQPPDSRVWIAGGDAPAFVKAEQPLYAGGPVWRIELAAPSWPESSDR
jgi:hypothetical protein